MNNDELIQKIKSGDRQKRNDAYKIIYDSDKIRITLSKIIKQLGLIKIDIDDIIQDAILEFDRNLLENDLKITNSIENYIIGIAKNMLLGIATRKKAGSARTQETFETRLGSFRPRNDDETGSFVEDNIVIEADHTSFFSINENEPFKQEEFEMEEELKKEYERIFLELSEKCRTVLKLKFIENMQAKEILNDVDLKNELQVRKKISTCRKKLQELCQESTIFKKHLSYFSLNIAKK